MGHLEPDGPARIRSILACAEFGLIFFLQAVTGIGGLDIHISSIVFPRPLHDITAANFLANIFAGLGVNDVRRLLSVRVCLSARTPDEASAPPVWLQMGQFVFSGGESTANWSVFRDAWVESQGRR